MACFGLTVLPCTSLAAASYVQGASVSTHESLTQIAVTLRNTQVDGDLNVVFIAWRGTDAEVVSVTDTSGNAYRRAGAIAHAGVATQAVYYAHRITHAFRQSNRVSVRFSAAVAAADLRIAEYHGIDLLAPLEQVFAMAGTGALASTEAAPTTHAHELVVLGVYAGSEVLSAGPYYTQRLLDEDSQLLADRTDVPPGTHQATAPLSHSAWYLAQAVAFREAPASVSPAPYAPSRVAAGIHWDFSTVPSARQAIGSDIWAMTWAADGNLYAAFGDGGGFEGTERSKATGRTSLGFARIGGTPQINDARAITGHNVWGQAPRFAESQATFGGKVADLISVGGVLYARGGLWTRDNCHCGDPTLRRDDNPNEHTLAWSRDLGKTWQIAAWHTSADLGSSLQFGPDYAGAADPEHVYLYYQPDVLQDATHLFLRRVRAGELASDPQRPGHYEYFTGTTPEGNALWSVREADVAPVFSDVQVPRGTYASPAVVYDAPLGRYLLVAWHGPPARPAGFLRGPHPLGSVGNSRLLRRLGWL